MQTESIFRSHRSRAAVTDIARPRPAETVESYRHEYLRPSQRAGPSARTHARIQQNISTDAWTALLGAVVLRRGRSKQEQNQHRQDHEDAGNELRCCREDGYEDASSIDKPK